MILPSSLWSITLAFCLMFAMPVPETQILGSAVLAQNNSLQRDHWQTLSNRENKDLEQGKVVLKGEKGNYLGRIIATGDINTAWSVLTDYNNFDRFLPNIVSSKVIETEGDRVLFEQINVVDLWLFQEKFMVQIVANKIQPSQVDFKLADGELNKLIGKWHIEEITPGKILVSHQVEVEPGSNTEKPFFYGIYESSLEETLKAIAVEINRRSK